MYTCICSHLHNMKEWFELFNVELYEVLIDSHCIIYSRCCLANRQFEIPKRGTGTEAKKCSAVDSLCNKKYFFYLDMTT